MKLGSPIKPYGKTKLIIEDSLPDWYKSNKNLSIFILRYFNPVGAHYSGKICEDLGGIPNNLIPYISKTAKGKLEVLSIFGDDYETHDGTWKRDFIHVSDLARDHLFALEKCLKDKGLHTYNLGIGKGTLVLELISALSDTFQ
ncbi:NAD-dependent epimerase/dehydratase family protein [Amylibacter sp.]|nr:NAD-dependent epimerase/dehydratase family protein [Amylibacter sp.]